MPTYIVPLSVKPTPTELKWAWKFTVLARANGKCQHCGVVSNLDACHLESRAARPDLQFAPDNGIALCRSCHMKMDHELGARPSGRPVGLPHTEETKQIIGEKKRAWIAANLDTHREMVKRSWDGRRKPERDCEHCGVPLSRRKLSANARFCSPQCHYAFRSGKTRSGY